MPSRHVRAAPARAIVAGHEVVGWRLLGLASMSPRRRMLMRAIAFVGRQARRGARGERDRARGRERLRRWSSSRRSSRADAEVTSSRLVPRLALLFVLPIARSTHARTNGARSRGCRRGDDARGGRPLGPPSLALDGRVGAAVERTTARRSSSSWAHPVDGDARIVRSKTLRREYDFIVASRALRSIDPRHLHAPRLAQHRGLAVTPRDQLGGER